MNIQSKIAALAELGRYMQQVAGGVSGKYHTHAEKLSHIMDTEKNYNSFFTRENILDSIKAFAEMLSGENLSKWVAEYPELQVEEKLLKIGVVMAGNIPMVGFHDLLCVLITGNVFMGKLSSQDQRLIPHFAGVLVEIEPEFKDRILFVERLKDMDAIIATGSNNSSRYFEYYFGKYPNIIRKNRNSVAVLTGNETKEDIYQLGRDIFQYFGLGCRNVSKLYVPKGFDFTSFLDALSEYSFILDNTKYKNNYEYHKSILLVNKTPHLDNGFLLLTENPSMASPVSVLHFEYYDALPALQEKISKELKHIQCVVGGKMENAVGYGETQSPQLWDYADGIDTVKFLLNIPSKA